MYRECRLFVFIVCCGLIMLITMMVVKHGGDRGSEGGREITKDGDMNDYIAEESVDIQSELNKMNKNVHSLKLTEKKVKELNGNKTLERFLRKSGRLRQKLLDVILNEEDKNPEPKNNETKKLKTKTIIYNRINKSGSTSLLGRIIWLIES